MTGFQRLPNGNTVMSNWLGHGKFGTAPHIIEVTKDRKVVWTFADHKTIRRLEVLSHVKVLLSEVPVIPFRGAPMTSAYS